jgi:D-aspartate ligase
MSANQAATAVAESATMVMPRPRGSVGPKVGPRPEVLLSVADAYGTLAAARSLGRAGIRVVLADSRRLVPVRWSRHVSQKLSCPDVSASPERFLGWLLHLGAGEPGRVLCSTSDDMAWLMARNRTILARDFHLYIPPVEAIHALLDKWRLHEVCVELGIDTPDTWLPRNDEDLRHLARSAPFPLVIKPRTQAFLAPHQKGRIVSDPKLLASLHRDLRVRTQHARMLLEYDAEAALPIVQSFSRAGSNRIYSLSGFIDETGESFIVEASRKVFQWPRHLGVGLCFEEAAVVPELAREVAKLCRHVGYYGAFEVEFVELGERRQLIDFNPRFYGQMGFDVARGLDLPLFAYLAAAGERTALREAIEQAHLRVPPPTPRAYCNRIELEIVLRLLNLTGSIDRGERAHWQAWLARHPDITDAVVDRDDWMPGAVDALSSVVRRTISPRSSWLATRASHLHQIE